MTLIDVSTSAAERTPVHTPLAGHDESGTAPVMLTLLAGEDEDSGIEPHIWRGID
ncbi:hypothetical protein JJV70_13750 [Streptomyces sp. JJ66]|uniref:hypothetical protein n=1 Tax=Streptomyces sp. JJ66 TaxID=2803843 RepID=UPI001C5667FA|nr:hypothetical protein [Streptomyces sp. JJ66]MBW1603148.1 hypothetical protein [Streptomyces sp. JJ66]